MNTNTSSTIDSGRLNRDGINRLIQVVVTVIIYGVILFVSAGRLDWWQAWVFLSAYLLMVIWNSLILIRQDPDLINERGRMAENQKSWDKVLMLLYLLCGIGLLVVAGLDGGRYAWSQVSLGWIALGLAAMVMAYVVITRTMLANRFLSGVARIQDYDRGHQVVTGGPYRVVRHPMYISLMVLWIGSALLLGSWWALIPAGVIVVIFVTRTALEDRMLQEELPGYKEYTQQTRYRLLPGIW